MDLHPGHHDLVAHVRLPDLSRRAHDTGRHGRGLPHRSRGSIEAGFVGYRPLPGQVDPRSRRLGLASAPWPRSQFGLRGGSGRSVPVVEEVAAHLADRRRPRLLFAADDEQAAVRHRPRGQLVRLVRPLPRRAALIDPSQHLQLALGQRRNGAMARSRPHAGRAGGPTSPAARGRQRSTPTTASHRSLKACISMI